MSDTLEIFGTEYTNVAGFKATDDNSQIKTYIRPTGSLSITSNDTYDVSAYASAVVSVSGSGSVSITDEANTTGTTCVIVTNSPTPPTPSETWETLYNDFPVPNADSPYNYFWLSSMADIYPTDGSVWRITADSVEYRCTAHTLTVNGVTAVAVGNPLYTGGTDDGSDTPFNFYNAGWGAWVGDTSLTAGISHSLKIERLVTE